MSRRVRRVRRVSRGRSSGSRDEGETQARDPTWRNGDNFASNRENFPLSSRHVFLRALRPWLRRCAWLRGSAKDGSSPEAAVAAAQREKKVRRKIRPWPVPWRRLFWLLFSPCGFCLGARRRGIICLKRTEPAPCFAPREKEKVLSGPWRERPG